MSFPSTIYKFYTFNYEFFVPTFIRIDDVRSKDNYRHSDINYEY